MKCDFCLLEKPVLYVGYGECACDECRALYLISVSGGWAFRPGAPNPPEPKPEAPRENWAERDPGFC